MILIKSIVIKRCEKKYNAYIRYRNEVEEYIMAIKKFHTINDALTALKTWYDYCQQDSKVGQFGHSLSSFPMSHYKGAR